MKREREAKNLCTAETYSPTIAPTKSDTELEALRMETPKNDLNVIQWRILSYGNSTAPFGRQGGAH